MYDRSLALGGATLGAAGGGLFGQLLSAADMPRRSLWNIPSKLAEGDVGAALPGLLGLGAGGLAAATGVGLPAAIGIGSLVGGIGQGVGESADPERFAAPTPEDVTGSDNWLLNALVGAVGDPLTYAGGFGGGKAGVKAGAFLDEAALARGPAYAADEAKLLEALGNQTGWGDVAPRIEAMKASPYWQDLLRELPDEPLRIASGAEATVAIPVNDPRSVVRIGGGPGALDVRRDFAEQATTSPPPDVRPNIPAMLQPARSVEIGPYRVEHLPFVEALDSQEAVGHAMRDRLWHPFGQAMTPLQDEIVDAGMRPKDMHPGNVGRVPGGDRFFVTDPGNAEFIPGRTPVDVVGNAAGVPARQPPGPILGKILDWIDGGKTARAAIDRDLAKSLQTGGITFPGSDAPIPPMQPAVAPAWAQGGARLDAPVAPWNVPPNSESLRAAAEQVPFRRGAGVGTFDVDAERLARNQLLDALAGRLDNSPSDLQPWLDAIAQKTQGIDAAMWRNPQDHLLGVPTPLTDHVPSAAWAELGAGRQPNVDLLELIRSFAAAQAR